MENHGQCSSHRRLTQREWSRANVKKPSAHCPTVADGNEHDAEMFGLQRERHDTALTFFLISLNCVASGLVA